MCTTSFVFTFTMKTAKIGRNQMSYSCRKSHAQTVWFFRKAFQDCPRCGSTGRLCRYFWTVRFDTRMPSFSSSPRMRSAPQSLFSRAIRWMSSRVSLDSADLRVLLALDFRFHNRRKPSRCQRMIVSGLTSSKASLHRRMMLDKNTSKPRSCARNVGRLFLRDATSSC